MNVFKLMILFFMILLTNFSMIRIDFGKFFKKNSTREIKVFVILVSFALGYLGYITIITIYELSLNFLKWFSRKGIVWIKK